MSVTPSLAAIATPPAIASLDLSGDWFCRLDPDKLGVARRWFAEKLGRPVTLPGSLPGHGIGDPVGMDPPWTGGIFDRSFLNKPAKPAKSAPA